MPVRRGIFNSMAGGCVYDGLGVSNLDPVHRGIRQNIAGCGNYETTGNYESTGNYETTGNYESTGNYETTGFGALARASVQRNCPHGSCYTPGQTAYRGSSGLGATCHGSCYSPRAFRGFGAGDLSTPAVVDSPYLYYLMGAAGGAVVGYMYKKGLGAAVGAAIGAGAVFGAKKLGDAKGAAAVVNTVQAPVGRPPVPPVVAPPSEPVVAPQSSATLANFGALAFAGKATPARVFHGMGATGTTSKGIRPGGVFQGFGIPPRGALRGLGETVDLRITMLEYLGMGLLGAIIGNMMYEKKGAITGMIVLPAIFYVEERYRTGTMAAPAPTHTTGGLQEPVWPPAPAPVPNAAPMYSGNPNIIA